MISLSENAELLGYKSLTSYSNVTHFVTTRHGGCSIGSYSTFNCHPYSGDIPGRVKRNQEILYELLKQKPDELIIPYQVHETRVAVIDEVFGTLTANGRELYEHGIDALITNKPGYCICVSTADCVPILLYDKKNQAIAAIHAGWRGTVNRIVEATMLEMEETYGTKGKDVIACIGPSISQEAFEVGDEVWQAFSDEGFIMNRISNKNEATGKWHINLWEANRMQLSVMGLNSENIEFAEICTYTEHELFFSARRLGTRSGRNISGIMLNHV